VESGNKVKTDRRDSRKLARLLEGNLLKRVHVPTEQERAYRELLRTRRQLAGISFTRENRLVPDRDLGAENIR